MQIVGRQEGGKAVVESLGVRDPITGGCTSFLNGDLITLINLTRLTVEVSGFGWGCLADTFPSARFDSDEVRHILAPPRHPRPAYYSLYHHRHPLKPCRFAPTRHMQNTQVSHAHTYHITHASLQESNVPPMLCRRGPFSLRGAQRRRHTNRQLLMVLSNRLPCRPWVIQTL